MRRRVLISPHLGAQLAVNKTNEMLDEVSAWAGANEERF